MSHARCELYTKPSSGLNYTLYFLCFKAHLTVLEDSLHIQTIGGAGLVVRAALQVIWQLSGPRVINHSGVGSTDGIWGNRVRKNIILN